MLLAYFFFAAFLAFFFAAFFAFFFVAMVHSFRLLVKENGDLSAPGTALVAAKNRHKTGVPRLRTGRNGPYASPHDRGRPHTRRRAG